MRKALLMTLLPLWLCAPVLAQKPEPREYPWEKTIKRIEAEEAKAVKPKKPESESQDNDTGESEKKAEVESKSGR